MDMNLANQATETAARTTNGVGRLMRAATYAAVAAAMHVEAVAVAILVRALTSVAEPRQ